MTPFTKNMDLWFAVPLPLL